MKTTVTFDGGGVRGLLSSKQWINIYQRFNIDLYTGVSAGSILSACYAIGMKPEEVQEIFMSKMRNIFIDTFQYKIASMGGITLPKHETKKLEKELRDVFGEKTLGDMKTDFMCLAYNVDDDEPVLFKSYKDEFKQIKIWEAVKASCSAPTFFNSHILNNKHLQDGGVDRNTLCLISYIEMLKLYPKDDIKVLHIGTGEFKRKINLGSEGFKDLIKILADIFMGANSNSDEYILKKIIREQDIYIKFNKKISKNIQLDDVSDESIQELLK
jgi:uncharacterized protein